MKKEVAEVRNPRRTGYRPVVITGEESLVQQQYKDEVDATNIVRRFGLGKAPTYMEGVYGDFTGINDFDSALAAIEKAEFGFMKLPPEVREQFDNDAGKFLAFADRATEDELHEKVGLKKYSDAAAAAREAASQAEVDRLAKAIVSAQRLSVAQMKNSEASAEGEKK